MRWLAGTCVTHAGGVGLADATAGRRRLVAARGRRPPRRAAASCTAEGAAGGDVTACRPSRQPHRAQRSAAGGVAADVYRSRRANGSTRRGVGRFWRRSPVGGAGAESRLEPDARGIGGRRRSSSRNARGASCASRRAPCRGTCERDDPRRAVRRHLRLLAQEARPRRIVTALVCAHVVRVGTCEVGGGAAARAAPPDRGSTATAMPASDESRPRQARQAPSRRVETGIVVL